MDEKRETLTKMLMQLMDQKVERSKELQDRLQEMDDHRSQEQARTQVSELPSFKCLPILK